MKEKCILTIIIPSYNVSKYVEECLPTYIDEKLFGRIKILLIDDGATDDTFDKISKYTKAYPHLFYFYHKENGGHGSVINFAFDKKLVDTKYFKVIDGDDWVDTCELVALVDYLDKCNDDVVLSGYYKGLPKQLKKIFAFDDERFDNIPPSQTSLNASEIYKFNILIHTVTYKTSMYSSNNIKLREKTFYEDNLFRTLPLQYVSSFSYVDCFPYCYRFGTAGQSVSLESSFKHRDDNILITSDLLDFYSTLSEKSPVKKAVLDIIICRTGFTSLIVCAKSIKESKMLCRQLWGCYKKYPDVKKAVIRHTYLSNKILIRFNFAFVPLFRFLWKRKK